MYGQEFEVSDEVLDKDFVIPFGKVKIMREGNILGYSRMIGSHRDFTAI